MIYLVLLIKFVLTWYQGFLLDYLTNIHVYPYTKMVNDTKMESSILMLTYATKRFTKQGIKKQTK